MSATTPRIIEARVEQDEFTAAAATAFDFQFDGATRFTKWDTPDLADLGDWSVGYVVGQTGTGKSLLLEDFGDVNEHKHITWDPTKAIISQIVEPADPANPTAEEIEAAQERLIGVGLNTVPSWLKPFHVLSTGERFRAKCARQLHDGAVIDEFTSNVDRHVAMAVSKAVRRYIDKHGLKRVVFAAPHYDVVEWLDPDWVFDTRAAQRVMAETGDVDAASRAATRKGRLWRTPRIVLHVYRVSYKAWDVFKSHHYLTSNMNRAARCYLFLWEAPVYDEWGQQTATRDVVVGFVSALPLPNRYVKDRWRLSRTVVLPDYQGLGIGPRISDFVAELLWRDGKTVRTRAAHPRLMQYRAAVPWWKVIVTDDRANNSTGWSPGHPGKAFQVHLGGTRTTAEYVGGLPLTIEPCDDPERHEVAVHQTGAVSTVRGNAGTVPETHQVADERGS